MLQSAMKQFATFANLQCCKLTGPVLKHLVNVHCKPLQLQTAN